MKLLIKTIFIPFIFISLFVYVNYEQLSPKLGLDLQGGISVLLTAEGSADEELIEQAVEIMRARIEDFGEVQEPEISITGSQSVLVQLPGLTDQEKALEAVGTTGLLTFRPVLRSSLETGYSPAFTITQDPNNEGEVITTVPNGVSEFTGISLDDDIKTISYLLSDDDGFPVIYEVGPAELSGADIENASAVIPDNEWIVQLKFKDESSVKFTNLTKDLAKEGGEKRKLAIVLDGKVVSAPSISFEIDPNVGITGGTAAITVGNNDSGESAANLAVLLRYGALPVSFERSSIQKVSATLGENTVNIGLNAGLVGIATVLIYILLYYRLLGMITILGLGSFGLAFYSILSLLSKYQGFTLTLAGIAGIIVSIGLAADSYIVTYEKFKDELKVGRSYSYAVEKSTKEAWRTILVADFVSLSAATLLFVLAVGPIKGFAISLGIATLIDLLYTRFYTRHALNLAVIITNNSRLFFPIKTKDLENV